jgi:hypothetical protein
MGLFSRFLFKRCLLQRHCEERHVHGSSTSEGGSDEAIHSFFTRQDGLLRRIRLRPKAGFGGQERSSQ